MWWWHDSHACRSGPADPMKKKTTYFKRFIPWEGSAAGAPYIIRVCFLVNVPMAWLLQASLKRCVLLRYYVYDAYRDLLRRMAHLFRQLSRLSWNWQVACNFFIILMACPSAINLVVCCQSMHYAPLGKCRKGYADRHTPFWLKQACDQGKVWLQRSAWFCMRAHLPS